MKSINPIDDLLHLEDFYECESVSIYPNPALDEVVISSEGNCFNLNVYSSDGALVANKEAQDLFVLDVSDYKKGIYLLQIIIDDNITTHKILVQ
ncbi:MAG: T9SS type A sorting domain-containing protein [Clostridia bacterium]|nr:T9SS type A sorting domain-containing protein [Clostridia bacterium]